MLDDGAGAEEVDTFVPFVDPEELTVGAVVGGLEDEPASFECC